VKGEVKSISYDFTKKCLSNDSKKLIENVSWYSKGFWTGNSTSDDRISVREYYKWVTQMT